MLSEADKYLVNAIQQGDYRAFEMLFLNYYSELCRYARGYINSDAVAEDLVSDLFVRLWEQPQLMAANISLKNYLQRSVHNSCINYITRTRIKFELEDTETLNKLCELMPSAEDSPYLILLTSELEEEIEKAISRLPAECGKIFTMSRKELMPHKEIAEQLHISENTVKVQIYRALVKLKEVLKEYLS
jgi:RNA polymerase sigma-70 factor (ECF subfamily)